MSGTIPDLAIATAVFLGHHFLMARRFIKAPLVEVVGKKPYMFLYSLLSVVLFVWMVWAYIEAPEVEIWPTTDWARNLSLVLNPLAMILLICGYYSPSPASLLGRHFDLDQELPWIVRISRHPVMSAVAILCLTHMAVNGDLASLIVFGANGFLALAGMPIIDAKKRARWGEETWEAFAAETSALPFVALLMRRTSLRLSEISWVPVLAGLGLYFAILFSHPILFGVSAFLE